MNKAFITYVQATQKNQERASKQHQYAVAQTAKEGRELKQAALVNSRWSPPPPSSALRQKNLPLSLGEAENLTKIEFVINCTLSLVSP